MNVVRVYGMRVEDQGICLCHGTKSGNVGNGGDMIEGSIYNVMKRDTSDISVWKCLSFIGCGKDGETAQKGWNIATDRE